MKEQESALGQSSSPVTKADEKHHLNDDKKQNKIATVPTNQSEKTPVLETEETSNQKVTTPINKRVTSEDVIEHTITTTASGGIIGTETETIPSDKDKQLGEKPIDSQGDGTKKETIAKETGPHGETIIEKTVNSKELINQNKLPITTQDSVKEVEVAPGVIFDATENKIVTVESGKVIDVLSAINEGIISSEKITIIDPTSQKQISLDDAVRIGVLNKDTGEIKDKSGNSMTFADAAKLGLVAIVGAPILAASKAISVVKDAINDDKKQHKARRSLNSLKIN
ncbi:unnamed protein product [Colias eurytheme]|nr:unnamed protein product [Colias eurytheme]